MSKKSWAWEPTIPHGELLLCKMIARKNGYLLMEPKIDFDGSHCIFTVELTPIGNSNHEEVIGYTFGFWINLHVELWMIHAEQDWLRKKYKFFEELVKGSYSKLEPINPPSLYPRNRV